MSKKGLTTLQKSYKINLNYLKGVDNMAKYNILNINYIINNVRNYITNIFFCCYKNKNVIIKERYSVND